MPSPCIPEGKLTAARNHTLHGFSSPDPLLPDEDAAEFGASLAEWRLRRISRLVLRRS
jgi:hypothetical protein